MNIHVWIFVWTYAFILLARYLQADLQSHLPILCLSFWGTICLLSKFLNYFFLSVYGGSNVSLCLQAIIFSISDCHHITRCNVVSHWSFDLHFPNASVIIFNCIFSFEKCFYRSCAHLKNWVICTFLVCGTGVHAQGIALARQVLYNWSHTPRCIFVINIGVLFFATIGIWTQGLELTRQVFHHLSTLFLF
jgi:hypothetical protein